MENIIGIIGLAKKSVSFFFYKIKDTFGHNKKKERIWGLSFSVSL